MLGTRKTRSSSSRHYHPHFFFGHSTLTVASHIIFHRCFRFLARLVHSSPAPLLHRPNFRFFQNGSIRRRHFVPYTCFCTHAPFLFFFLPLFSLSLFFFLSLSLSLSLSLTIRIGPKVLTVCIFDRPTFTLLYTVYIPVFLSSNQTPLVCNFFQACSFVCA